MKTRVLVTVGSTSALLMNPVTEELLDQIRDKTTPQKKAGADYPPEAEARDKLCWGDAHGAPGKIGLPAVNLYAALKGAGRKVKNGRSQVSTATNTTLFSFLKIVDEFLVFKGDDIDQMWSPSMGGDVGLRWQVDKKRGTNPNGGQLVVLVRPKFEAWSFDVLIEIDDSVNPTLVRQLFDMAGKISGLGDFRPSTGGPYGCFEVTNWVVLEEPLAAAVIDELETGAAGNGHVEVDEKDLAGVVS